MAKKTKSKVKTMKPLKTQTEGLKPPSKKKQK